MPLALRRPRLSLSIPTCSVGFAGHSHEAVRDAQAAFDAAFQLGTVLGSGAYAVVKRARRRDDGSLLAVKCVRSDDHEHHRLVRNEFDLLRSIDCKAVVFASEMYECGESSYMCLELCNAGNVRSYVQASGPFNSTDSPFLFGQVLQGIRYIHRKRIVHCDIKYENLLLHETEGRLIIKIADFNSAKRVGDTSIALPISCRGTHMFRAPELLLYGKWDERVDIWSCGLCFYFMMCGHLPFDVSSPEAVNRLRAGKLPRFRWGVTDALIRHLMQQCLLVDDRDRPPALELAQHRLFLQDISDDETLCGVSSPADVCQWNSILLSSCGLIAVHNGRSVSSSITSASGDDVGIPTKVQGQLQREPSMLFTYERCFRDVDRAFRQLAHVKFVRGAIGEDRHCRSLWSAA